MATEPLYRFRFFDDVRKRWMVAGYRASETTIKDLYPRYELMGDPQPRQPHGAAHGSREAGLTTKRSSL